MDGQIRPRTSLANRILDGAAHLPPAKPRINKMFPHASPNRGTGKSTALALQYIAQAIRTPNTWIVVNDHCNSVESNRLLLDMIRDAVHKLGLNFFRWKRLHHGECSIRFDIFEE